MFLSLALGKSMMSVAWQMAEWNNSCHHDRKKPQDGIKENAMITMFNSHMFRDICLEAEIRQDFQTSVALVMFWDWRSFQHKANESALLAHLRTLLAFSCKVSLADPFF